MQQTARFYVFFVVVSLCSTITHANDFSRQGWFAGLNLSKGFNFITEAIDAGSGGKLNTQNTWGFDARGGYRFTSWFALEGNVEYMSGFKTDGTLGSSEIRTNTVTVAPKFILPFWRVQPYALIGIGAQHSHLDFSSDRPLLLDDENTSGWNAAMRPALGMDFYITEKFVANLELAAVLVAGKFEDTGMSISDPIYLSVGGGFQYRF